MNTRVETENRNNQISKAIKLLNEVSHILSDLNLVDEDIDSSIEALENEIIPEPWDKEYEPEGI